LDLGFILELKITFTQIIVREECLSSVVCVWLCAEALDRLPFFCYFSWASKKSKGLPNLNLTIRKSEANHF